MDSADIQKEHIEPIDITRHSLAHILAAALLELYPNIQFGVGPVIENGFYYDVKLDTPLSVDDFSAIEKKMKKIIGRNLPFERVVVDIDTARKKFLEFEQRYKVELIDDLKTAVETEVSLYQTGEFVDLCRGPHIDSTGEINANAFKLTRVAGAYWRGNEKNDQLQRIYGIAFNTKEELDTYLKNIEEAKKRDHKKLGKELDLFYIDDAVGKGLPLWTPKGTTIKHLLVDFTRALEKKYGYEHVETPFIGNKRLYELSGHLAHYQSNMYAPIDMDGEQFYLRPMACPHHVRLLQRKPLSYRDLPVRYAEVADYSRFEKSGELMGMIRVRKFQLTDAHIFVAPENAKEEFKNVCALIQEAMQGLGMDKTITYRFSKRDPQKHEKYFPDDELWNTSESLMREALDEIGLEYTEAEDEAAFYGPKLDVQGRNVNGKEDTLFTAQFDFLLPEKFDITYKEKDGSVKRPIMIHRSAIGSLERTFAFLIEHFAGAFPVWLSPVQVAVVPVSEKFSDYAQKVYKTLEKKGVRAEIKNEDLSLGKRIALEEKQKTPYILIVGEKESTANTVSVRSRQGDEGLVSLPDFTKRIAEEVKERS